jgi:hypothetical protein|nr:MAG TPA: hypothetical protein [Caudoviricetes sp.]
MPRKDTQKNKITTPSRSNASGSRGTGTNIYQKGSGTTTPKTTSPGSAVANGAGKRTTPGTGSGTTLPSLSQQQKENWDVFAKGSTSRKPSSPAGAGGQAASGSSVQDTIKKTVQDLFDGNSESKGNWDNTKAGSAVNNAVGGGNAGSNSGGYNGGSGYSNGGLTADQIRQMQEYYGTTADGLWGANSSAASGGMTAEEAWNAYRQALEQDEQAGDMSWESFLERMGANDYEQRLRDAISSQVQQAVDDYNRQIDQAGTSYEDAARRAYINKMLSKRNMDQELAANGVYGGMADSQRIAAETAYQNDLTDLETQYSDTMAQLQQAITAARLSGDAQMAEQMANYLSQIQSEYNSYLQQREQERAQARSTAREYSLKNHNSSYTDKISDDRIPVGPGIDNYRDVERTILLYAGQGNDDRANQIIQQTWRRMDAAQRAQLAAQLARYGLQGL